MSNGWVLVDGYSVMHGWKRFTTRRARALSLQQRREELVKLLCQYADQSGRRVTIVFDGYAAEHKSGESEGLVGIEVVFSEKGKTADDTIERLVAESEERARIRVVTSDRGERNTVDSFGAESVSAEMFEMELEAALHELAGVVRRHSHRRRIGAVRERWKPKN